MNHACWIHFQNLGAVASHVRDFETALRAYEGALQWHVEPSEKARTFSNRGVALWELGRVEEALFAYVVSIERPS